MTELAFPHPEPKTRAESIILDYRTTPPALTPDFICDADGEPTALTPSFIRCMVEEMLRRLKDEISYSRYDYDADPENDPEDYAFFEYLREEQDFLWPAQATVEWTIYNIENEYIDYSWADERYVATLERIANYRRLTQRDFLHAIQDRELAENNHGDLIGELFESSVSARHPVGSGTPRPTPEYIERVERAAKINWIKSQYNGKTVMHPSDSNIRYTVSSFFRGRFPEWIIALHDAGELDSRIRID